MTDPELVLRVGAPVGTVVQIGRIVVEPRTGVLTGIPESVPGREAEIAAVVRAVGTGAPGVVVHGRPGLGTTAIALAASARLAAGFPGGAWFVAATDPDPRPVLGGLLRALGMRSGAVPDDPGAAARLLRAALADRPALLVLDGARTAGQVRALLPHGRSALVATATTVLTGLQLDGLAEVPVGVLPATADPAGLPRDLLAACQGSPLAARLVAGSGVAPEEAARALGASGGHPERPADPHAAARAAARLALSVLPAAQRRALDAAALAVRSGIPVVDPAACRALLEPRLPEGGVAALLRALLARGLLSARPGAGGPWCAVPTAVLDVLPDPRVLRAVPAPAVPAGPPVPPVPLPGGTPAGAALRDVSTLLDRVQTRLVSPTPARPADPLREAAAAVDAADRAGDPLPLGHALLALADRLADAGPAGVREAQRAYDTAVGLLAGRDDPAHAAALHRRGLFAARRDRPAAALADLRAAAALHHTLGSPEQAARSWQEVAELERAAGQRTRAIAAHRTALAALTEAGDPAAAAWTALAVAAVQVGGDPDPAAVVLPDSAAGRSVRALHELDPEAPDWAVVSALAATPGLLPERPE